MDSGPTCGARAILFFRGGGTRIAVRLNETGARGDGKFDDRAALQAAVDRASAAGGDVVVVPSGMRCLTGTLTLVSRIELHMERGAALVASGSEGVSVTGRGVVEGHAPDFMIRDLGYIWEPAVFRPRLLCFYDFRGEHLEGISFHDAPSWTVHLIGCDGADIEGIAIDNNLAVPNRDGIDPNHCRNMRIRGCRISCTDDAIVVKTSAEFADRGSSENIHRSD